MYIKNLFYNLYNTRKKVVIYIIRYIRYNNELTKYEYK